MARRRKVARLALGLTPTQEKFNSSGERHHSKEGFDKDFISDSSISQSKYCESVEITRDKESGTNVPTATVVGVVDECEYDSLRDDLTDKIDEDSDLSDTGLDDEDFSGYHTRSSDKIQALTMPSTTSGEGKILYEHYMPHPHLIFGLMMPSRNYHHHSIEVMSRVVERMVSDGKPESIWAVIFRNSVFAADFHETFLASLRRTPQIVAVVFQVDYSLTSAYTNKDNVGSALGYLGGMLPSTVKWLSFDGALTKEGLQILCILLKKNNAAFLGPAGARDVPIPSDSNDDSNESDGSDSEGEGTDLDPTANKKCFKQFARLKNSRGFRALRGLVGLAVTGCASIDSEQMTYLCELLSFIGGSNSPSERNFQAHRNTTKPNNNVYHGRGLKLMDLCRNRLSDSQ